MRKGKRVRVLRTNECGTVAENQLLRKNGRVSKYCRVVLDKKPELDTWYMEDDLGSIVETVLFTATADNGQELYVSFEINHDKGDVKSTITGNPDDLQKHSGSHIDFMTIFLKSILDESNKLAMTHEAS